MSVHDASGYAGDLLGWRSELSARIQDFLARKALPATGRLGALVRRLESAVSTASLKAALGDLLHYLRKDHGQVQAVADAELEEFFGRIREFRRHESIESYASFLFTVSVDV